MRKLASMLIACLMLLSHAWAQNKTVTGKVTNESGAAISNASVTIKGTRTGTVTGTDGSFTLNVPSSATILVISYSGYTPTEASIQRTNSVFVKLAAANTDLDGVVVVGYGSAKSKSEVAGSVVQVRAERLQNKPVANITDALQGKVPGLQIYVNNGEPSATPSIRLNGVGSLGSGSTPLIVLDGIPVDPGTIQSLNPEDIESVTVLRDASSTAIYGTRASNGVVYYTTKKGKANNFQVNLTTQYAISSLIKNTEDLYNSFMNTQQFTTFLVQSGQQTQAQVNATLANYKGDTKWYKYYYQNNVPTYQTNLNLSGGAGKTTYYVSGGYFKQEGLAYRSGYERYTFRSNLATSVKNWLDLGVNMSGGYDKRQSNPYGSNSLNRGLALLSQPFYSPLDSNGNEIYGLIPGLNRYAPKYLQDKITSNGNNIQINPTGYIQLKPYKGLTLRSQGGMDFYEYRSTDIRYPSYIGSLNNGSVSESFTRGNIRTITNTIEYRFDVANRHSFTALAGQEYIDGNTSAFSGASTNQTDDRLLSLSQGTQNITASSSLSQYSYLSYFGRLNYNLDRKYFLDLSIRNDQSSRFGRELQGATFYSVGASWNVKQEKFLDNASWLDNLILKASYGTTGNSDIGNYTNQSVVASSSGSAYNTGTGFFVNTPGNPLLSWETAKQANFGIQAKVFKKLTIDAEFFNKNTSDMYISVPYALTSGFSSVTTNTGSLNNHGINLGLNYDVITAKDASLSVYGNLGWVEQKVTELFQGKQYYSIPNTGVTWAVGQPVTFYYPIFSHVDPATGNPLWFVPNADPNQVVYTNKDSKNVTSNFNSTGLLQNTGIKRYAPLNGGFGLSGQYKGFELVVDFIYSKGKYLINNDRYFFENPSQFAGYNQSTNVLDYWKKPGDVTRFPRYGVQFTQFDSRLIEDASFMRLKNLTVGYSVPRSVLAKTKVIAGVRAYVTFRNLLTFTKYTGPDPEVDSNLSLGVNPNTRQTAFGLNFNF